MTSGSLRSVRLLRATATVAAVAALVLAPAAARAQSASTTPSVMQNSKVGAGLYEIVVGESSDTIYVASTGADNVKIFALDPKTLAVKTTIDTSAAPAFGLAINNKTNTIYTSNTRAGSVSAIDAKTGAVIGTIRIEAEPRAHTFKVLVDEDKNLVYVSIAQNPVGKIWIIDGKTNQLSTVIEDAGARTTGMVLDKASNRLFASSLGTHEIVAIDLATNKIAARFPSGGQGPMQLAFDPATSRLFVANQASGELTVLDSKTGTLLQSIKTGAGALGIGFNPKNNFVYVANRQAGTVTVVDVKLYEIVAQLQAGTLPNTVAVDPRTGNVYVTNKARNVGRGRAAGAGAQTPTTPGAAPPSAPAAPPPPPPDEGGDTVTLIRP